MLRLNNLSNHSNIYKTFGYRFINSPQMAPTQLFSIGWQMTKNSQTYYWDGMNRNDEKGHCIFQYTLSGSGIFEFNGETHTLKKGEAFIADIPSNHKYYIPKESENWEFIFVTLTGHYAMAEWRKIQEQFGNILHFTDQDEIIQLFWRIYSLSVSQSIADGYETSAIAYKIIMNLWRSILSQMKENQPINNTIISAIGFMKNNYHKSISLDNIADAISISKYHFTRTFQKTIGVSPWKYLTKIRIEAAANLLLTTDLTGYDISKMCGYESQNYFDKVFRKYVGMSPGKFRQSYDNVNDFTLNL